MYEFKLRNGYKIKYLFLLVFCPKISLDFRYNALHCASNPPYFGTKFCAKLCVLYFFVIPKANIGFYFKKGNEICPYGNIICIFGYFLDIFRDESGGKRGLEND